MVCVVGVTLFVLYAHLAGPDLAVLGEPVYIFDENHVYDDRAEGGLCGGPDNLAALQGVLFVILGLCLGRRCSFVEKK